MNLRRPILLALGVVLITVLGGCSRSKEGTDPPKPDDIDVPALSDADRRAIEGNGEAIRSFVETTPDLPSQATTCEERISGIAQDSIDAREEAEGIEDVELRGLLVNHSAAVWDYVRLCAAGESTEDVEKELAFYEEILSRWLAP